MSGAAARTGEFSKIRIKKVVRKKKEGMFNIRTHNKYRTSS